MFAAECPTVVATALGEAAHRLPASAAPTPAYAAQFAAVRTDVAVCTTETLTAQSLRLLGHHTASPESSLHSSIHHWLQTAEPSVPPSSQVEPSLSSNPSELHPPLPLGADAAIMAPRTRTSRVSHSTRRTRRSATSSVAAEILGFSREMTGHLVNVVGQMQAQAQVQQNLNQNQLEAMRADAKIREEKIRNENLVREQMLVKMKTEADEASCKREQFYMDHEFKRQKLIFDCNTAVQQEKIKSDSHREIACMEVMERRELEFQHAQEKERERAIVAQQKLRELVSEELQERIQLERGEKQCVVETQPKMFENTGVLSSDRPTMVAPIAATATTTTVSYVPAGMTRVVQLPQQQQMLPPVWPPFAASPPTVPLATAPPPVTSYAATTQAVHVAPAVPPPAAPAPVMPYTLCVPAAPVAHAVSPLAATIQGTLPPIFAATAAPAASTVPAAPVAFAAPAVTSSPPGHATLQTLVANLGAATCSTSVASGLPVSCVPALMDFKSLPTGAPVPATFVSAAPVPTLSAAQPVAAAPTVIIRQHETVRPYTGATSYKTYKEYFSRIASCNGWSSKTDCARHLLVAMDGPAAEAVRGLKAEKDGDLDLIWEALARRFGFVDERERAMRRFDNRRQLENETLAVYEQNLRTLHREAWPATDLKSPEADSLLRRKFIDAVSDPELQKYLRLHATGDDFAATVLKAKHFIEANELSRSPKSLRYVPLPPP